MENGTGKKSLRGGVDSLKNIKIKYPSKPYKVIDDLFEGQIIDKLCQRPNILHNLLKNFKHVEIDIIGGVYFIKYRNLFIANIKDRKLTLTPGIYLNSEVNVFKTYNFLLRNFTNENLFIKFLNKKWVFCKEEEKEDGKEMQKL